MYEFCNSIEEERAIFLKTLAEMIASWRFSKHLVQLLSNSVRLGHISGFKFARYQLIVSVNLERSSAGECRFYSV